MDDKGTKCRISIRGEKKRDILLGNDVDQFQGEL